MLIINVVPLILYATSLVNSLPIISKPLDNNPDHLVWEALLTIENHHNDNKTPKIPKSIFITPNLNDSNGNCPKDHKLGPDGKCYKTLNIDPLVILKSQIESLFKRNRTATTEYEEEEDYDYEYNDSTESLSGTSMGDYTIPLSLGFPEENKHDDKQKQPQVLFPPYLNRIVKDDSHVVIGINLDNEKMKKPFLVSSENDISQTNDGADLGTKSHSNETKTEGNIAIASSSISPSTTSIPHVENASAVAAGTTTQTNGGNTSTETKINISESDDDDDEDESNNKNNTQAFESVHDLVKVTTEEINNNNTVSSSTDNSINLLPSSTERLIEDGKIVPNNLKIIENAKIMTDDTEHVQTDTDNVMENITLSLPLVSEPISNLNNNHNDSRQQANHTIFVSNTDENEKTTNTTELTNEMTTEAMDTTSPAINNKFDAENVELKIVPDALSQVIDEIDELLLELGKNVTETTELHESTTTTIPTTTTEAVNNTVASSTTTEHNEEPQKLTTEVVLSSTPRIENKTADIEPVLNLSPTTENEAAVTEPYELIDAYFIPSRFEEIEEDPESAENQNKTVTNDKVADIEHRSIQNAIRRIDDDISVENITSGEMESIKKLNQSLDSVEYVNDDGNINARLAEELLFSGIPMALTKSTAQHNDNGKKSVSHENDDPAEIEETLNGASRWIDGSVTGIDFTTEETIDYVHTDNDQNDEQNAKQTESTAKPIEKILHDSIIPAEPPGIINEDAANNNASSIYSTFIRKLLPTPQRFAEHPLFTPDSDALSSIGGPIGNIDTVSNGDITSKFDNQNPPLTIDDAAVAAIDALKTTHSETGKSLQLGINCYLKNLVSKQYYIICT